MQWQVAVPYTVPLFFAAAFAVLAAFLMWQRRAVPGAHALFWLGMAAAIWSFAYAMEIGTVGSPEAFVWARLQYIGIVTLPVAWVLFALSYTGRQHLLRAPAKAALLVVPLLTQALVWTNGLHGLIWPRITLDTTLPIPLLIYAHGPAFWICNIFSHICLVGGTIILLGGLWRAPSLFMRQIVTFVVGAAAPWIGNAVYVLGLNPWPGLDLTPFAFTFTMAMVTLLVLRLRFLEIVPVAYERVVASMTDGVLIVDQQDRILDMNAAGLASIGRELRDIVGLPVELVFDRTPEIVQRYRTVHNVDQEIDIAEGPDGPVYVSIRISPILDRNGRQHGRLVVWRDITERRRAEEMLRRQNEELIRLQAFLERAIDEARAANRAKSAFLANMSHELRTPLNAILGYSELMQLELAHEGSGRFAKELMAVRAAGTQLLDLINSLLDLTKIEANRMELYVDRFLLLDLLDEVARTIHPLAVQAGNSLEFECAADIGWLHTDRAKLGQILLNLLSNASKFTHGGSIWVRVWRLRHPEPPDEIVITVEDTGIGIAAADLPLLFQDFVQVDGSTTRRYGGTGLGLAISRRFSRLMGGDISVASVVGKGTIFTLTIPADLRPGDERAELAETLVKQAG
jgi:PAS domain S-box-containing protein